MAVNSVSSDASTIIANYDRNIDWHIGMVTGPYGLDSVHTISSDVGKVKLF